MYDPDTEVPPLDNEAPKESVILSSTKPPNEDGAFPLKSCAHAKFGESVQGEFMKLLYDADPMSL